MHEKPIQNYLSFHQLTKRRISYSLKSRNDTLRTAPPRSKTFYQDRNGVDISDLLLAVRKAFLAFDCSFPTAFDPICGSSFALKTKNNLKWVK